MVADVLYIKDSLVDVILVADHFVMVTTIELDHNLTQDEIETETWSRLRTEYGNDWTDTTRQFVNKISIEVMPSQPTINDIIKSLEEEEMTDEYYK